MSRLGRKPISIPDKVKVSVSGSQVLVEGPQGKLTRALPSGIQVKVEGNQISVLRADDSNRQRSLHGTLRKLVLNMVEGASAGFTKGLQIEGVGFRAQAAGDKITFQLGYSHNIEFKVPAGVKVSVDAKQTAITVQGPDRELVGQVAAEIRDLKRPEPYKGTGIRYVNEHIRRKAGKAAVGAGGTGGAKK
jgi:large subunit ribosomal protein L6